ncbi:MAG: STAS/SEC14 domain-containing protein [Gaiellaceae bacterium]
MIELIEGLPDGVLGIEAVGKVTSDDYNVVTPAIESALAARTKIRLIHVLGERFTGFTAGGMWADGKFDLAHVSSFERVAVVTDHHSVRTLVKAGSWAVPGEMRLFSNAERDEAVTWASADKEESNVDTSS